jgi:hypothetical protein
MNSAGKIDVDLGSCFYEDSKQDKYFMQFCKDGEVYHMGDCALIQCEEMTVNPNRELIEEDFRREDSEIIYAHLESIKDSPNRIIALKRTLEENGMQVLLWPLL